jgi:non-ribosomal peptide synthetase component E (peptide arylation enzyme)
MITTLAEIFLHTARRYADRAALVVDYRRFSFHKLDALSNRIANEFVPPLIIGVARSRN